MAVVVGVLTETQLKETRVAVVPEIATKLKAAGARILIERGAGTAAHFPDALYADAELSDAIHVRLVRRLEWRLAAERSLRFVGATAGDDDGVFHSLIVG